MKKFYNHQTIKIEEYDAFTTFQFNIDIPEIYGLDFYEELDNKMQKYIKKLNSNKPTLIQIVGDFDVLSEVNDDEIAEFLMAITNLFVGNLISEKKSARERRLGLMLYPDLAKSNLTMINKINIINYEIKFPIFQLEVIDKSDNIILSIF